MCTNSDDKFKHAKLLQRLKLTSYLFHILYPDIKHNSD